MWVVMETEIVVAASVLHLELLAYQVLMVSTANLPRQCYLYT